MALSAAKLQIIILGDGAVGKTSILKMYAEGKYTPSHITTIGKNPSKIRTFWRLQLNCINVPVLFLSVLQTNLLGKVISNSCFLSRFQMR